MSKNVSKDSKSNEKINRATSVENQEIEEADLSDGMLRSSGRVLFKYILNSAVYHKNTYKICGNCISSKKIFLPVYHQNF